MPPDNLDDAIGLWLVADFGATTYTYGLLDKARFEEYFVKTGDNLENGYIDVVKSPQFTFE